MKCVLINRCVHSKVDLGIPRPAKLRRAGSALLFPRRCLSEFQFRPLKTTEYKSEAFHCLLGVASRFEELGQGVFHPGVGLWALLFLSKVSSEASGQLFHGPVGLVPYGAPYVFAFCLVFRRHFRALFILRNVTFARACARWCFHSGAASVQPQGKADSSWATWFAHSSGYVTP